MIVIFYVSWLSVFVIKKKVTLNNKIITYYSKLPRLYNCKRDLASYMNASGSNYPTNWTVQNKY